MKKTYHKPLIAVESFTLVEHIAYDCVSSSSSTQVTARTNSDCAFRDGNVWVFNSSTSACLSSYYIDGVVNPELEEMYGSFENYVSHFTSASYCYNAFSNGTAFGS